MSFHVRRKDREITDSNSLKQILKSTKYVTIALCLKTEPYLVSLSHGYDETRNCLYFHCANAGKKLAYLKANNTVWGQAVQDYSATGNCDYTYASVHFKGAVSLLDDLQEKQHGMTVMVRQLSKHPEAKLAKIKPAKLANTTMGRIDISHITGKKHLYLEQ